MLAGPRETGEAPRQTGRPGQGVRNPSPSTRRGGQARPNGTGRTGPPHGSFPPPLASRRRKRVAPAFAAAAEPVRSPAPIPPLARYVAGRPDVTRTPVLRNTPSTGFRLLQIRRCHKRLPLARKRFRFMHLNHKKDLSQRLPAASRQPGPTLAVMLVVSFAHPSANREDHHGLQVSVHRQHQNQLCPPRHRDRWRSDQPDPARVRRRRIPARQHEQGRVAPGDPGSRVGPRARGVLAHARHARVAHPLEARPRFRQEHADHSDLLDRLPARAVRRGDDASR